MEPESLLLHSYKPATCSVLSQINPVPPLSYFLKIHFTIILTSTPGSSNWFPTGLPTKILYTHLSPICAPCPTHFILLNLITQIIFHEEHRSLSSSLCSLRHSPVTSSLWDPNILHSTLFSKTHSLHSSLSVSDQVSHPYKTTSKISSIYLNFYIFG